MINCTLTALYKIKTSSRDESPKRGQVRYRRDPHTDAYGMKGYTLEFYARVPVYILQCYKSEE